MKVGTRSNPRTVPPLANRRSSILVPLDMRLLFVTKINSKKWLCREWHGHAFFTLQRGAGEFPLIVVGAGPQTGG